ncbi:Methyltransferase type 11, partial [Operophtera brumata]
MPSGSTAVNLNKGISLVFNKEANRLEDKRRKDILPGTSGNVLVTMTPEIREEKNCSIQSAEEEVNEPSFLGTIYKELYEKRKAIEQTKSLSHADRDSVLSEIVDRMVVKINASKSTPSIKKLIDIDTKGDLKDWGLDLLKKKDKEPSLASTYTGTFSRALRTHHANILIVIPKNAVPVKDDVNYQGTLPLRGWRRISSMLRAASRRVQVPT